MKNHKILRHLAKVRQSQACQEFVFFGGEGGEREKEMGGEKEGKSQQDITM